MSGLQAGHGSIHSDFLQEAERIIGAAKKESVLLRLLGALAFNMHCTKFNYMQKKLQRSFSDIDFASYRRYSTQIVRLFLNLGYQEDVMVTRLYGTRRLVFLESGANNRHCDIFLDKLEFCHDIPFEGRLEADDPTVPLAELLLEKMQIVKLNQKDVVDTIMLVREHQIGNTDEAINAARIASLCARDWGLWRTVTNNLNRIREITSAMEEISADDKADVSSKIKDLLTRIDDEPKTTGWKMRARIGEKRKWYREVEETLEL